ncbi:hypothetical protein [Proteus mirabilis]|uniref:hypothetical protein n=1 Tax=Proteus mirabilis TaxID=584 RepID=UPI0034D3E0D3
MAKSIKKQLLFTQIVKDDDGNDVVLTVEKHLHPDGTVEKVAEFETDPVFSFHVRDPFDKNVPYPTLVVPRDEVKKVTCRYADLHKTLAKITGKESYYKRCLANNGRGLNKLHNNFNLFGSDLDLADYKMAEWKKNNPEAIETIPLSKAYSDIEVDIYNYDGFPDEETAPCAINFVSYVNPEKSLIKGFLLYDNKNPSLKKFMKKYGITSLNKKYSNKDIPEIEKLRLDMFTERDEDGNIIEEYEFKRFEVIMFEDEMDLIIDYIDQVNNDKPDFNAFWNAYFDIRTIWNRIIHNGFDPHDVFSPREFEYVNCFIKKDTFANDVADRAHTFEISSYTKWQDLLFPYAANRKATGSKDSWKLNDVLLDELGETKHEFEGDIKDAAYTNYEEFFKYSIFDSYRLYQLERKCNDLNTIYGTSMLTNTRMDKVYRKTISIRNLADTFFEKEGSILSNNFNKYIQREKQKFRGALIILAHVKLL